MWVQVALMCAGAWCAAAALAALLVGRSIRVADRHHDDERLWRELRSSPRSMIREDLDHRWRGR